MGCRFMEASEPAARFNPNEPDGKYALDAAMPAQRQVRGVVARFIGTYRWGNGHHLSSAR